MADFNKLYNYRRRSGLRLQRLGPSEEEAAQLFSWQRLLRLRSGWVGVKHLPQAHYLSRKWADSKSQFCPANLATEQKQAFYLSTEKVGRTNG
jgi:hypothetical protein